MNIVEFIRDPNLFGGALSPYQETALRLLYGLPLSAEQETIAKAAMDVESVPRREYNEATFICGRRSGKTDRLAANVVVYEATMGGHEKYLSLGEKGNCILMAQDKRAAKVAFRYVLGKMQSSQLLVQMIANVTAEEIELKNGITISVFPCSFRAPRSFSVPICVLDEFGYFRIEGANVDKDVVDAIRPAMATFPKPRLIKISSPYGKQGELYRDFTTRKQRPGLLCFQAASWLMNPTIPQSFLDAERERDPEYFSREYEALFSDSISNAFTREAVEACIEVGRYERPFDARHKYLAACDPSGGGADEFTLAIAHQEGDRLVQDLIRGWKARQPHSVVEEAAQILKSYGVRTIVGDRYSGSWVQSTFATHGITYQVAEQTASEAFLELLPLINQGRVELLDDKVQTAQLINLERRSGRSGRDQLSHARGGHDDRANSLALLAAKVTVKRNRTKMWNFLTGEVTYDSQWAEQGIQSAAEHRANERVQVRLKAYYENPDPLTAASLFTPASHPERLRWLKPQPTSGRDAQEVQTEK